MSYDPQEEGRKAAKALADTLNSFSDRSIIEGFIEEMENRTHRTLQQGFTRLCVEWLKACRNNFEEGRYDGRNEASCDLAAKLLGNLEDRDLHIPCI